MKIPIQLQKKDYRFKLLGHWGFWKKNNEIHMMEGREYEKISKDKNWKPLGKAPHKGNTTEYSLFDSALKSHIQMKYNYGVQAGPGSLRIIDVDNEKLIPYFENELSTLTIETGSGGRHYYVISEYDKNHRFKNSGGEMRCKNWYVVGPNSTHPNGKMYKVVRDTEIQIISDIHLLKIIGPHIIKNNSTPILTSKDTSRSGKEFGIICSLLRKNKTKEEIFSEMNLYSKWANSSGQYRELTYNKALEIISKKIMNPEINKKSKKDDFVRASFIEDRKRKLLIEQLYDPVSKKNTFCIYDAEKDKYESMDEFTVEGTKFKPLLGEEIQKGAIFLPSEPIDYDSDVNLQNHIKKFIHKWLDIPSDVLQFAVWNILMSWVYELFHTINYLRALGDTGTGKSRFLDALGVLHYKSISTSGATTSAPVFRIIDKWKGSLIIDEADLKKSDEAQDMVKIINQGYEKNRFIMRCDTNNFDNIRFFDPFCPKILGSRKVFTDKAVESRCITHVMRGTNRKDIPLNLNKDFYDEALLLRNKLLLWRFRNYYKIDPTNKPKIDLGELEPRVKQIVGSYICLFSKDKTQLKIFKEFIGKHQDEIVYERKNSFDGQIVETIHKMLSDETKYFNNADIISYGELKGYNGNVLSTQVLSRMLKSLGFKKAKLKRLGNETKRVIPLNKIHLEMLFKRYGLDEVDLSTQKNLSPIDKFDTTDFKIHAHDDSL
ncbi:hypothetical protein HN827_08765 [archaeon]|jgi:hypothetical protein|nr:hypothetical protein [archaeon]MBT4021816.1 hypothetical protein [archaeon]MBT4271769.1 hypothetical protein [archaeon]MBT4461413.1 hypothetical protein [archaeon]MBT6772843.1 hypothetical protein [archaeon]